MLVKPEIEKRIRRNWICCKFSNNVLKKRWWNHSLQLYYIYWWIWNARKSTSNIELDLYRIIAGSKLKALSFSQQCLTMPNLLVFLCRMLSLCSINENILCFYIVLCKTDHTDKKFYRFPKNLACVLNLLTSKERVY